jgi:hypothetical protein
MSRKTKLIILLIFISVFLFFCGYSYFTQVDNINENDLPLLKAQTDIKSKPDDPGGMNVLNKDKAIYNHMLGKKKIDGNVNVIDGYEKPVSKENLESLISKQLKKSDKKPCGDSIVESQSLEPAKTEEATKQEEPIAEIPAKQEEVVVAKPKRIEIIDLRDVEAIAEKSESIEPAKPIDQVKEKPKQIEQVQKAEVKPPILVEKYTIRVAKLKDKKFFAKGTEIFKRKHPVLYKYKGELVENNGDYFLNFSNIKSKQEAESICKALTARNDKCFTIESYIP